MNNSSQNKADLALDTLTKDSTMLKSKLFECEEGAIVELYNMTLSHLHYIIELRHIYC